MSTNGVHLLWLAQKSTVHFNVKLVVYLLSHMDDLLVFLWLSKSVSKFLVLCHK